MERQDEEFLHLRQRIRVYRSRLHILELQAAKFGAYVPPQVLIEITDIREAIAHTKAELVSLTPGEGRAILRRLKQQAFKAFHRKDWAQAEDLLAQALAIDLDDSDMRSKLEEVQRQLDLQAFYQAIRELRDEGRASAVLDALGDLECQQPGYPDSDRLRWWAEQQQ
jgi:hypothetical protein